MGFLNKLGKAIMQQATGIELMYLGGHPQMTNSHKVFVNADENGVQISGGFRVLLSIPYSDIVNVSLDRANKRSLGKGAAGALIGGVLTGGIGLIAGAALGGRKKDDSVISLTVKYGDSTVDLLFGGEKVAKKYAKFTGLVRRR